MTGLAITNTRTAPERRRKHRRITGEDRRRITRRKDGSLWSEAVMEALLAGMDARAPQRAVVRRLSEGMAG